MYRAKARLQGSYAVYQPGMHEAALRRLELKADLQRAIDTDALTLEYQPIFRLADGDAVGAEALLRWPHPDRGHVPVAETLALAEATGLMMPLGAWVLDQACRSARRWRDQLGEAGAEVFVSVNASARELLDPSYAGPGREHAGTDQVAGPCAGDRDDRERPDAGVGGGHRRAAAAEEAWRPTGDR